MRSEEASMKSIVIENRFCGRWRTASGVRIGRLQRCGLRL
jgi:hypothetical protein